MLSKRRSVSWFRRTPFAKPEVSPLRSRYCRLGPKNFQVPVCPNCPDLPPSPGDPLPSALTVLGGSAMAELLPRSRCSTVQVELQVQTVVLRIDSVNFR